MRPANNFPIAMASSIVRAAIIGIGRGGYGLVDSSRVAFLDLTLEQKVRYLFEHRAGVIEPDDFGAAAGRGNAAGHNEQKH